MGRFETTEEDWKEATEKGEKAEESGSMFIARRMKSDLQKIYVVFLEIPQFGMVTYKEGDSSRKGQANVISFGKDGSEREEGVFILEMAPKHHNRFMTKLRKPKYGLGKLYEIERHGAADYPQTYYEIDDVRDLTQAEMDEFETVEMHELFMRKDDTAPATTPPAPATAPQASTFMKQCAEEAVRLGWAKDKEALKSNMTMANTGFFKGFIASKDMSHNDQQRFLEGLRAMTVGQGPGDIVDVTVDALDLDEDVDFF